jgi:hypothetical protein
MMLAAMLAMVMVVAAPVMAWDRDGDCYDDDVPFWSWVCDDDDYPYYYGYPVEVDVDYEGDGPYDQCYLEERDWDEDGFWELEYVCY